MPFNSTYFKKSDFDCAYCQCGANDCYEVDVNLLSRLEVIYKHVGKIEIVRGFVCEQCNKSGMDNICDKHYACKAADIKSPLMTPARLAEKINKLYGYTYGIGIYKDHVHFDIRYNRLRWDSDD